MHQTQTPNGSPSKNLSVLSADSVGWEIFDRNIQALEANKPLCFRRLKKEIEEYRNGNWNNHGIEVQPIKMPNGELNLLYKRLTPATQHLVHSQSPSEEAMIALQKAKLDHPQLVFFFGMGLAYAANIFFKNRPKQNFAITIVEPDTAVFFAALRNVDYTELLNDSRTYFIVSKDISAVRPDVEELFNRHILVSTFLKIVPLESSVQLHSDFFFHFGKLLMSYRDVSVFSGGNSIEDSFLGADNQIQNFKEALNNPGLHPLADLLKGKTMLSVASGPSTDEHWEQIKRAYGKIPIVVCDSSLKIMLKKGIEPDFVTAVERTPLVTDFFKDVKIPERTTLICPSLLLKESLEAFCGNRILYAPVSNISGPLGTDFLACFFPGSSAGNLNVALAAHMGCSNVIMVGHNLAFDPIRNVSHLKGTYSVAQETPMELEELMKVSKGHKFISQDGTMEVHSNPFWFQFKGQMEVAIARHPEVNFINVAAKGARIEGCKFMSFDEALEKYGTEEFWVDSYSVLKANVRPITPEDKAKRVAESSKRAQMTLDSLELHLPALDAIQKKLAAWKQEIEEKEARGRKVSLAYLDDAIDDVLKLKVAAVNDDMPFYTSFISIITAAHFAFEREVNAMPGRYNDNYALKRDFLLRHIDYFRIWEIWLPKMRDLFKTAVGILKGEA